MFNVIVTKKAMKGIEKMPHTIQLTMAHLIEDLIQNGPILRNWSNFSKIGINQYHCHLAYKWVACWEYLQEVPLVALGSIPCFFYIYED